MLHFNFRCYEWANSISKFDCTHPFVVEHRFNYKFLERYFDDFKKKSIVQFTGLRSFEGDLYQNWMAEVVDWWNTYLSNSFGCNRIYKRKQLYLYGGTNVGKSSLVELLIGRQNMKYVFYPGVGKFFMQGFDHIFHKVIVFEEFNIQFYKPSFLKRLLEGRKYSYPVKCGADIVFNFKGPIIFVSNDDLRDNCYDYALLGRLKIINANEPVRVRGLHGVK